MVEEATGVANVPVAQAFLPVVRTFGPPQTRMSVPLKCRSHREEILLRRIQRHVGALELRLEVLGYREIARRLARLVGPAVESGRIDLQL